MTPALINCPASLAAQAAFCEGHPIAHDSLPNPASQYLDTVELGVLVPVPADSRAAQLVSAIGRLAQPETAPVPIPATLIRTAAQRLQAAQEQPPLQPLFGGLWESPGIAILGGDTGVGKSILAVHIAHALSSAATELLGQPCEVEEPVLYYDFELTDRQFNRRFEHTPFTDKLLLGSFNPESADVVAFTFAQIAADLERTGARLLILDNITALSLKSTADAEVSIAIMTGLKKLQTERGVSSLVLAHTPKLPLYQPLSLNDLAGSKHLSNFADSVFFIARSTQGPAVRYLKQLKNRTDEEMPGVLVCEINGEPGHLGFTYLGHGEETDHLATKREETQATAGTTSTTALLRAALPDLLHEPQSASSLEDTLAKRLNVTPRTVRTYLSTLLKPGAAPLLNLSGQTCHLTKEQGQENGRQVWYLLCPLPEEAPTDLLLTECTLAT